ncbi:MAG: 3-isopropylmalate dehydratase large subunit [Chloroflexi bacterium]|nr:3-isopropylmalate dehydratase large subunit [Chloroflexota bacterium]
MGETMSEKILSKHAGQKLKAGQLAQIPVDLVLANDITAPISLREFKRLGVEKVFDPEKVVLVPDHFAPNKDIKSAEQCKQMREFARSQELAHYFEVGRMGIEHALLPEQGLVRPGEVVVGADSHTCTYGALGAFATGMGSTDIAVAMATGQIWMKVPQTIKFVYKGRLPKWVGGKDLILHTIGDIGVEGALYMAMEFTGEAVGQLSVDGRLTMSNMAIEAGGKAGLFNVDDKTVQYLKGRTDQPYTIYRSDPDAAYARVIEYDVTKLEPQVAFPHLPSNARPLSQVGQVPIDQAVIGSCTNGRLEDLEVAAMLLNGRQVARDVRCIIIPATQQIYLQAVRNGWAEIFVQAGAVLSTPTCGPCLGGHMGILAAGERCVSTTNRNFVGRMGHPQSEVYLAGPAVAAASAVLGRIGGPDEL